MIFSRVFKKSRNEKFVSRFSCFDSKNYDLIVHIGAPKTGSSALQLFLVENRKQLKDAGFYYPQHGLDENGVSGGHSTFGMQLVNGDLVGAKKSFESLLAEARAQDLCLLLSAESFYGQQAQLKLLTVGLRVGVIAYFRDPIACLISNYNQGVKRHFSTATLSANCHRDLISSSPGLSGAIFQQWEDAFGTACIRVLPYDLSAFPERKIEYSFLDVLGISAAERHKFNYESRSINSSYTPAALELKRLFNHVLNQQEHNINNRIDQCLQRYSDGSNEPKPTAQMSIGTDLYAALADKFSLSNQLFKDKWLRGYPEGFLQYPQTPDKGLKEGSEPFVILQQVLVDAFVDDKDLVETVRLHVSKRISSAVSHSYPVLKLAELLGFEVEKINLSQSVFLNPQMNVLTGENSQPADLLREVSSMLERCGQYDQAYLVISRALSLRPNGPGIIAAHARLKELLETRS